MLLVGLSLSVPGIFSARAEEGRGAGVAPGLVRSFPGILLPDKTALIKSPRDETVAVVNVKLGRVVRAGDLLIRLSDAEMQVAHNRAVALREQARADLERIRSLHAEALTSQEELEATETILKIAEADCELAALHLEECYIRAPFDGVAAEVHVDIGTSVETGDDLIRVTALSPLRMEVLLPEELLRLFAYERTIRLIPTYPDTTLLLSIAPQAPVVDPGSGTFTLQVPVANPDHRLIPGVSCQVTVMPSSAEGS